MRIVIAGGQTKADFLIGMFKKNHHKLVVINDTTSYAEYLVQKHKIDVIVNDATSKAALADAGIENFDVLVALLPSDADNLAVCQLAKNVFHVKKTVAAVSDPKNVPYFKLLGIDSAISATYLIAKQIEKASVLESAAHSIVTEFDSLAITTMSVQENSLFNGMSLKDIALPEGISIGAIMRKEEVIVPKGNTVLQTDDRVLIISNSQRQEEAIRLFNQIISN